MKILKYFFLKKHLIHKTISKKQTKQKAIPRKEEKIVGSYQKEETFFFVVKEECKTWNWIKKTMSIIHANYALDSNEKLLIYIS